MRKRDAFRLLYGGRYIIIAVGVLCAILAAAVCIFFENRTDIYKLPEPPKATGEYLTNVEALDKYAFGIMHPADTVTYAPPEFVQSALRNLREFQIASAYADILNNRTAKDMASLLEAYESRAAEARAESERLMALAWQAKNSAQTGSVADYADRMRDYAENGVAAGKKSFEAEYCENIIALMSDSSVSASPNAEDKVKTDIEAIYAEIEKIEIIPAKPLPFSYEAAAVVGFFGGALLCAAVILIIGALTLAHRLKKQRKAASGPHRGIMDDANFRG